MEAKLAPSPKEPSGILAIQIHQMADLEITRRAAGRQGQKADTHTPSTYAQVVSMICSKGFFEDVPSKFSFTVYQR